MEQNRTWGLSGGTLKIIALITMIIDHATYIFIDYGSNRSWYLLGRGIGRLAFPIYCFLIVEGFYHTRSVLKYAFRLFLFALLSEIPFNLAFYGTVLYPKHQNVFFTLLLGVILMYLVQYARTKMTQEKMVLQVIVLLLFYGGVFLAANLLQADYGVNGVILILLFYLFRGRKLYVALLDIMMNLVLGMGGNIQRFGAYSAIPISCYNGRKGISLKYFFYLIYPLHLLAFYWIKMGMS